MARQKITVQQLLADYPRASKEYDFDASIFSPDSDRVARLKWILAHRLTRVQKTIIILYAECGSFRKLGRALSISKSEACNQVADIRRIVKDEYRRLCS